MFVSKQRLGFASKMAGWHFALSAAVALLLSLLVFFIWYPFPYRGVMGSFDLFWLVVGVDVCCGPLLTFILANPAKKMRERIVDMSLVVLIQLAAFFYGMYSVYESRPVVLVFEIDRLRLLSPPDILLEELPQAEDKYQTLPHFSMFKVAAKPSEAGGDTLNNLELALQGYDIGQRPSLWMDYDAAKMQMQERASALSEAKEFLTEEEKQRLNKALQEAGLNPNQDWRYLPLTSNYSADWLAILNQDMQIVSAVEIDAFALNEQLKKNKALD